MGRSVGFRVGPLVGIKLGFKLGFKIGFKIGFTIGFELGFELLFFGALGALVCFNAADGILPNSGSEAATSSKEARVVKERNMLREFDT